MPNTDKRSIRIAFYGKGGIGKSTIASNVAAAFSRLGLKVLFIGCDPKSDSTRTIMGRKIEPVIRLIQAKGKKLQKSDFMQVGFNGIHCIETGGPEAGVGCAGRGIIPMMEELENHRVLEQDWDAVIFDVLGDVVCGGFAVPMREQYVDAVYIVSSSEFMSVYAANNIMKSIVNFSEDRRPFLGGMIYNQRNSHAEKTVMARFAQKTATEILAEISYSDEIALAELEAKTTVAKGLPISQQFIRLAQDIYEKRNYKIPKPLSEEELELFSSEIIKMKLQEREKGHA